MPRGDECPSRAAGLSLARLGPPLAGKRADVRPALDGERFTQYIETIVASNVEEGRQAMQVRDGMSPMVLTIGPGHTLRDAARSMSERQVGAAVVIDPDAGGLGILTERDVLTSIGAGENPDFELVANHLTRDVVFAEPSWSLEEAAAAMVRGGFRHLIVVEHGETVGILSVRDVVRCWTDEGAICPVPASAAVG
jgi:CBS domain-containing protein